MPLIPLFPLNTVLFPGVQMPLLIFEERYKLMINRCLDREQPFGVALIRSGQEVGGPAEPFDVGTTARITQSQRQDDGRIQLVVTGEWRFRIRETLHDEPYLTGDVDLLDDEDEESPITEVRVARVRELYTEHVLQTLALSGEWTRRAGLPRAATDLADHIAARLAIDMRSRQRPLLEALSVPRRLEMEEAMIEMLLPVLRHRAQRAPSRSNTASSAP
ncbi:MAG: LON peptidase substrate-binding domain-containing protein [Dehalococcoidia bacterium]